MDLSRPPQCRHRRSIDTQMVQVTRLDGTTYEAHAKFAEGAENGRRGLAAELLAGALAALIGANVPPAEVVELRADLTVRLRNGIVPAPGLAVASETMSPWVDVNAADTVANVPAEQLARLSVFESWTEVGDRGHNLILCHELVFAIDFASAFSQAFSGSTGDSSLVEDALLRDRLSVEQGALLTAVDRLSAVTDHEIDLAVRHIPTEWLDDASKAAVCARLQSSRNSVVQQIRMKYSHS